MLLVVLLILLRLLLLTVIPMLLSSMVLHMLLLWLLMLVIRGVLLLLLAAASVLLWEVSVRRLEMLLLVLGDCGRDGRGRCLLRLMVLLLLVCRRVEQVAGRWLLLARRGISATSARLLLPDNVDISAIIVVVIRLLMLLLRLLIDCSTTILRKVLLELLLLLCCRCRLRLLSAHCHASTTAVVTILQLLRRLPLSSIDSTILLLSAGCHYLHPAPLAAILLLICRVSALILVLTGAGRTHLNVLIGSLTLIQKVRCPGRRIEHLLLLLHHASVRRRGPGLVRR